VRFTRIVGAALACVAGILPASAQEPAYEDTQAFVDLYRASVTQLRRELVDNRGARFRDVFFTLSVGVDHKYHRAICGEINSPNRAGGFTGWQPFFSDGVYLVIGTPPIGIAAGDLCSGNAGLVWLRDSDLAPVMERDVTQP